MGTLKEVAVDQGVGLTTLVGTDAIFVEKQSGQLGYALGSQLLDLVLGFLTEATPKDINFGNNRGTQGNTAPDEVVLNPVTDNSNYYYFIQVTHTITVVVNQINQMKPGRLLVIANESGTHNLEIMLSGKLTRIWTEHILLCFVSAISGEPSQQLRKICVFPIFEVVPEDTRFLPTAGSQTDQPTKGKWTLTANVTNIPIDNGWEGLYFNASATDIVLAPSGGSCIVVEFGATQPSVSLAPNKAAVVMGNGSNLLVFGDVI